jgi:transcriptional regulator with XRE-family HTH domain
MAESTGFLSNFGSILKLVRQKREYSRDQLAAILNTTALTIASWEEGRSCPDLGLFFELCKKLHVLPGRFITAEIEDIAEKEDLAKIPKDILKWMLQDADDSDYENIRQYIQMADDCDNDTN